MSDVFSSSILFIARTLHFRFVSMHCTVCLLFPFGHVTAFALTHI